MKKFIRCVLAGTLFASLSSISVAVDYGRTAGSFGVSPTGSANYSIPIWTPPGPNGITPSISVNYSSQGGNGVGGVGWNLSASSSIERCNRTKAQDGNAAAVDLSASDRYCIGGSRLRLGSGTYGAAGSVYYTEIADYARITAYSAIGSGPDHFIVEAKSGLKYEYGNNANSRVVLGTNVLRWMLNKVSDRSGNNYIISYNNATGIAVPDVISWTPTSLGAGTYRYEAKFNYLTTRTDTDSYIGKVAGNDVINRNRLEYIQIKSAGVVVRKYRFAYDTSTVTSRSRLTSAKECADDAETNCLSAITFSYQTGMAGVTAGAGTPPAGSSNGLGTGRYDLNGDGKNDIVYLSGGVCYAAFGANTGFAGPYSVGTSTCGLVDKFLPNGRDAIALTIAGTRWIYRWDDATSTFVGVNTGVSGGELFSADYDGDGLADFITYSNTQLFIRRNTSSSASSNPTFDSSTFVAATLPGSALGGTPRFGGIWTYFGSGLQRADLNGDGRQDIYAAIIVQFGMGATPYFVTLQGSSAGYLIPATGTWVAGSTPNPAVNFNGDACTDRIQGSTILISQCNGIAASSIAAPATPLQLLDWNGDGKTDILVNSGGTFAVYLSTGTGFSGPISTSIASSGTFYALDQDGDHQEDLIKLNGTSAISYWTHTSSGSVPAYATNIPDLLSGVTDGFGVNYTPNYVSTAWSNYDKGANTPLPLQESDPSIVTAQVTSSNGIGGTFNKTYFYVGARGDTERNESAGFQRFDETDTRNGLITRTYFEQTFPLTGMLFQSEIMQPGGTTTISREVFTNTSTMLDATTNNQRYFTYTSGTAATQYEVGGTWNASLLRTITTANTFDSTSGTLYDQTVTTTEPASGANGVTAGGSWVARTYLPLANLLTDPVNWCLGRPQLVQQINSSNLTYGTSITRTTNVTWNASYCRPTQTVAELGSGTLQVTTDIGYDSFGNVNSTAVTGVGMTARTSSATYSDVTFTTGQFPLSATNALSQTSYTAWNYDLGVPTSTTDPNGIATAWQYDPYGRRTRENRPDNTATTWAYSNCAAVSGGCLNSQNKTTIVETRLDTASGYVNDVLTYLDQFDRPITGTTRVTSGSYNRTDQEFDALGRIYRQSAPCIWSSCTSYWTTNSYDLANRPTAVSRPISDSNPSLQTTNIYYEGLTTRVVDPQSKQSTKVSNAAGQIARSLDHDSYYQSFDFDAFGNLKRVQDSAGALQSSNYNLRGMLTDRTDMDMGTWTFEPNALGEAIHVRDAKTTAPAWTQTLAFDALGRQISRQEAEGTSTWTWGVLTDNTVGNKYIGRLKSVSGPGYSESYTFDSIGRPSSTSISADTAYQIDFGYNSAGALDTLTYPTSTSSYRLKLQYDYQYGQLYRIRDYNALTTVFWTANAVNGRNQITQETLGANLVSTRGIDAVTGWLKSIQTGVGGGSAVQNLAYTWDLAGNLVSRKDVNQSNLTETFFYDNLYRLDYSQLNNVTNQDLSYDVLGNITSKADVGTYTYHATKRHQVTSTSNGWSFGYDSNGNMTSGRGQSIDWTSYNYPSCIRTGATCTGTTSDYSQFSYTPDRQYWQQVSNFTSGGSATTYYIGGILEKVHTSSGDDYRHMIRAGNSTIIVSRQSGGTNSVYYVTKDNLGSSSAITNSSGAPLVNESFDAFGKRRGSNWAGNPSSGDWTAIAGTTRHGFTDHSMLDNIGLIHMNGRVQDPILGRFVSADPLITEPINTQNYNRYSYVYNNPFRNIDPSGFGVVCFLTPTATAHVSDGSSVVLVDDDGNEIHNADGSLAIVSQGQSTSYSYSWQNECRNTPEDIPSIPGDIVVNDVGAGRNGGDQTPQEDQPCDKLAQIEGTLQNGAANLTGFMYKHVLSVNMGGDIMFGTGIQKYYGNASVSFNWLGQFTLTYGTSDSLDGFVDGIVAGTGYGGGYAHGPASSGTGTSTVVVGGVGVVDDGFIVSGSRDPEGFGGPLPGGIVRGEMAAGLGYGSAAGQMETTTKTTAPRIPRVTNTSCHL